MQKKMKKLISMMLAGILLAVIPLCAGAQSFSNEEFSVEVPDDMYQFSIQTPLDDPTWGLVGITDPQAKLKEYSDMGIIANFVSKDGATNLTLMKKESDYSKQVFNLSVRTPEEKQAVLDKLSQAPNEQFQVKGELYSAGELDFFTIQMVGELEDGSTPHEQLYGTIVNGCVYSFDIYNAKKEISEEELAMLKTMANSFTVPEILPIPSNELTTKDIVITVVLLSVVVLLIVVPIIYFSVRKKIDKRKKAALASKLEAFHQSHSGDTITGELLFTNSSDCTREAIHTFSVYHAYWKNLTGLLLGGLLCVATVIMAFVMDTDWWLKLIAAAVTVYYFYKVFTAATTIEKVQRKVYDRGHSSTAIYAFYDDAFRVSGVQSASVYAYFQLTAVKKYGHYLYLYYGPDNAYIVDCLGFKKGTEEEFVRFISGKTKM